MAAGGNGATMTGGKFAQRPNQPSKPQKVTARPFAKDNEPRQKEEAFATLTPLFFYGTLLSASLRRKVLGAEVLASYSILPDWKKSRVPKLKAWTIRVDPGHWVRGIRVDVTAEQLAALDRWENHDAYCREAVMLAEGTMAEAYVHRSKQDGE